MYATVKDIESLLNELAPVETAEAYDNVGALVGSREREVRKILVALDATMAVVREAEAVGADLIVTHHPLMFHGRKNLLEEDPEGKILCEMIRGNLSLIAAHTNLDQTAFSGSACCARLLNLQNIRQSGFLFLGDLPAPLTAEALLSVLSETLQFPVRRYGNQNARIATLAVAGGAADELWEQAKALGAQALLTGEIKHHNALAAAMSDFVLFDGGHWATEAPLVPALAEYLQNRLNDVQCDVRVYPFLSQPFGCL